MPQRAKRLIAALSLVVAVTSAASVAVGAPFATGEDVQKFGKRELGPFYDDGQIRRACICRQAGDWNNGVGFVGFIYSSSTDLFKAGCMLPQMSSAGGNISAYAHCAQFDTLPPR